MVKQLKIGFIQAASKNDVNWFKPLSYGYLKSYVEKYSGFPLRMTYVEDLKLLEDFDIVGVSSTSQSFSIAKNIGKKIKEFNKNIVTIIGGHHITYMPETLPEQFDVGVMGEGEETFLELIRHFQNNGCVVTCEMLGRIRGLVLHRGKTFFITPRREQINPMDGIPHPDRSDEKAPYFITSRGCPYKCSFCSSSAFWDKTRFFSAEYVVREVEHVLKCLPNLSNVAIWDDLFVANKPRFKKFVKMISEINSNNRISFGFAIRANLVNDELCEDLKKINTSGVSFGAESGANRILNVLQKGTTVELNQKAIDTCFKHKIPLACSFIVGVPSETEDEVRRTYEFALRNVLSGKLVPGCPVNVLMPMPGTAIWEQAINNGLIDPNNIEWERLAIFASYRNSTFTSLHEWVAARRKNRSVYLAEDTLPESRLYELMCVYEDALLAIETERKREKIDVDSTNFVKKKLSIFSNCRNVSRSLRFVAKALSGR
jgi:anaerobic magnesium-protoporphyrin IX monomethyl ester cyclase